ncbi:hypothetical protein [Pontibacillus salipaludis]|uniref:Uncharacterized protein n=1 Tax=Pontibacillus salipaludis TaxID=1697394 RepID=A0ABQ1PIQ0_9BACI|nr:hypothetical protein [Pontibacillus salipaludis]GGC97879.1 hypothetical protein GCM10011389_01270 [Pontibacillus salipaludis]
MYLTEVTFEEYVNFLRENENYFYDPQGNPVLKHGMDEIVRRSKHKLGYSKKDERRDLAYLCNFHLVYKDGDPQDTLYEEHFDDEDDEVDDF